MSFCSLIKEVTPKICMLCFALINSVFLNFYVFEPTVVISEVGYGRSQGQVRMIIVYVRVSPTLRPLKKIKNV